MSSIIGLLVLAADVYAILTIIQNKAQTSTKVLWIVLVLVLPFLGVIVWYFTAQRGKSKEVLKAEGKPFRLFFCPNAQKIGSFSARFLPKVNRSLVEKSAMIGYAYASMSFI